MDVEWWMKNSRDWTYCVNWEYRAGKLQHGHTHQSSFTMWRPWERRQNNYKWEIKTKCVWEREIVNDCTTIWPELTLLHVYTVKVLRDEYCTWLSPTINTSLKLADQWDCRFCSRAWSWWICRKTGLRGAQAQNSLSEHTLIPRRRCIKARLM